MPDPQDINNPFFHESKTTKASEQDKFKFDPSTAKPVQNKSMVAEVEGFNFDPSTAKAVNKGLGGHIKDFGASLAAGAASLPDIALGLGDLYTGGRVGKAVEDSGIYNPGSGSDHWRDKKTINAKAQQQQFDTAEGVVDKTKVALSNPSMISNAIGESLAPMAAGGLAGRAVNVASKGAIGAAASGAIGEGTVMAGSQAESIRQQTDDGLLSGGQTAAAAATGVAGTLFGFLGGRIAQKLGFDDIDNMMANGISREATEQAAKDIPFSSIPKSVLMGAVSEGILEELPQSLSEQALQNIALDKPWYENLDDAAVMGTLAGMAMGGGINAYTSSKEYLGQKHKDEPQNTDPNVLMLPGGSNALEGEFIPGDRGQATTDAQGRTTYEYDQFSTDADNLLGQGTGFNPMQGNNPENPDSPIAPTTPPLSRQLGINPEDGPMSTAAALAVDGGATETMLNAPTVTDTKQDEINNNAPLSNAAGLLNAPTANTSTSNSGQDESTLTSTTGDGSLRQASDSQLRDESGLLSTTANSSGSESANDSSSNDLEQSGNSSVISNAIGDDGKDASGGINNVDSVSGVGEPSQATQGQSDRNNVNTVENDSVLSEENAGTATSSSAIGAAAGDSQSRTVDPILGVDGQNKWFASQDKANAFIEKKKLGNDYQVVQNDKRFEIQPKESQLSAITPKVDAVTPTIDNKIKTMQHQFDSEKSIPKKLHLQKQLEDLKAQRADITTQEQLQVPVQKQAISSSFQTQPLDHGTLNVPLAKRGNIDNQLDRYKKEQAVTENEKREIRNSEHADAKSVAKPMFDTLSSDHIKVYADKAGIKPSEAKKELKSMAHWQPEKAVKVFEALKAIKAEQNVPKKARLHKQIAELQKNNPIDRGAHEAATSTQNDLSEPTQAQIEAGNYKKGHIKVHGLDIAVENPRGSERRGTDPDGKEWAHTMSDHYGYIKRTTGADQEQIDTYVGKNPESEKVYIVDQINQGNGSFDEHKVMMGFDSQEEAVAAYQSNFEKGWKVGPVKEMSKDQFKDWLKNSDTSKPAASKNLKDSIENIRAEKIRKKTVDDLHRLFASAPDIDLEKAITRLDKAIQKNHEKSIGEMNGGKRSTRKAVASGAVDNFRKQKMDLEAYLKARKSGKVKQRETSVLGKNSKGLDDARLNDVQNQEKPLYSRQSGNQKTSSSIQQVRDVLVERFGEDVISELERQGKLEIIQDYQVEGVEGFYYNGKAVLVASNLTAESTVPTFLHELGGHAGFQNMMNQKQYNELMNQFNKLVEQGNPVALAAKMLAEREQGSERQQLEYLPYLLTLSSTMQQRNVIQRNALQKLINNIVSYVKSWVFDNFGINLNLNPDDILALSERMIGQIKHQSSLDLIRQKYHGTNQWMTAPNGEKTHLSEQQWLQVRTPEFKKWFGDWENDPQNASEVMDENGEPKVVYHGTAAQFTEFNLGRGLLGNGIYLVDNLNTAKMYANIRSQANTGVVMPLFVNMRNSFKTNGTATRDDIVAATATGEYQGVLHSFENDEFLVAFQPNQVKMAIGNVGTFDGSTANVLFSRTADLQKMLTDIVTNMNKSGVGKIKDQAAYKFKDVLGHLLQGLGRRQLTEIYNKILPQLEKYNRLAAQMDADKNEAGAKADDLVVRWAIIADEQQLAELMHETTIAKIDPSKPYVSGDSVSKYKQLRDSYRSLSPEAQQMYADARDAYREHHLNVRNAIKDRILRTSINSTKKAELMRQMDDNFFHSLKGVYFPLARFGKYVVLVRDSNGVVESVNRAETMAEAQTIREELIKQYPYAKVENVMLDKEFHASRDMVGRGFMTNLFDELDKFGLSTSKQAELEDILGQLYLSSLPDLSWAKHGIHRKGTKGFSQDARRAFAQNMFHGAGYLAKLRYADVMEEQLDGMQEYATDQAKKDPKYDQPVAQRVIDEMNKRHENLMSPDSHPLSSALTSLGFIYYLGLSPASALVNLLQTALVAYPVMGAKWGFDKSAIELNKAAAQAIKGKNDISKSLTGDELKAYNEAVRRGVIDVTQAQDLAGIAQGEDSGVMWKLRPIMRLASLLFHQAERFNREVTFIAGYRLARQTGAKHDDAFEQAMDATYKGHFDYSSGNRPRIMQGNVAKVIFLFKQFGQNMLYTMARAAHQSFNAETPEARKEALKALMGILGMHTIFAGTLGLPLVSTLLGLVSFLGGGDDEPFDAEAELRNWLAEAIGKTSADVLMRGVSRATPWDISGRVSINNLILPNTQEGLEGKQLSESTMAAALGPVAGIFTNLLKGMQEIGEGHRYRGVETMMPTFLRSVMRSGRFAAEGVQDKTGVSIQDEVGILGLAGQAAGFAPSDVRLATEGKSAIYQNKRRLDARRSELLTNYSRAKMNDDREGIDEVWKEIQNFNEKNPSRRITKIQAMQSYKARKKRIDTAEHGVVVPRKKRDDLEAGAFAFGE